MLKIDKTTKLSLLDYPEFFIPSEHILILLALIEFIMWATYIDPLPATQFTILAFFLTMISKKSHYSSYIIKFLSKIIWTILFLTVQIGFHNLFFLRGKSSLWGIDISLLLGITFLIILVFNLYSRKSSYSGRKSISLIVIFTILYSSFYLYNGAFYVSNRQLRRYATSIKLDSPSLKDKVLSLDYIPLGSDWSVVNLKDIDKFENVEYVQISGNIVFSEGLKNLKKLKSVDIYNPSSIKIINTVTDIPNLEALSIDYFNLRPSAIIADMKNLKTLKLHMRIPYDDSSSPNIGHLESLTLLSISSPSYTRMAPLDLSFLDDLPSLEVLVLKNLDVNTDCVEDILKCPTLYKIRYMNSNIRFDRYCDVLISHGIKLEFIDENR